MINDEFKLNHLLITTEYDVWHVFTLLFSKAENYFWIDMNLLLWTSLFRQVFLTFFFLNYYYYSFYVTIF